MNPFLKEKILNFISSIVFALFVIISVFYARKIEFSIEEINLVEFLLIILATYRVSRMVVYEKVFSLIRYFLKSNCQYSIIVSLNNLITCPWCTSVWVSLFIFDIYYFLPYGKYFIYILAISSVAAPLILFSNYLNMKNDILRKERNG